MSRKTFMDRAITGEIEDLYEAFEDEVGAWHNYATEHEEEVGMVIHIWLGMTWQEYGDYISCSLTLEDIVKNRLN